MKEGATAVFSTRLPAELPLQTGSVWFELGSTETGSRDYVSTAAEVVVGKWVSISDNGYTSQNHDGVASKKEEGYT